jgi:hypothetical protein
MPRATSKTRICRANGDGHEFGLEKFVGNGDLMPVLSLARTSLMTVFPADLLITGNVLTAKQPVFWTGGRRLFPVRHHSGVSVPISEPTITVWKKLTNEGRGTAKAVSFSGFCMYEITAIAFAMVVNLSSELHLFAVSQMWSIGPYTKARSG